MLTISMGAGCQHMGSSNSLRSECSQLLVYSAQGDHKAAVDGLNTLKREGYACPESVEDRISISRRQLETADSFVRLSMNQKKKGDLAGARESLEKALEIYPRYYWVSKLLRGIHRTISTEVESLLAEARYLESTGDLEGSRERIEKAITLAPEDEILAHERVRLNGAILAKIQLREAENSLLAAKTLMEEGHLNKARELIVSADAVNIIGERASSLLGKVNRLKNEKVRSLYMQAKLAWKEGRVDEAMRRATLALELRPAGDQLRSDMVDFARLLGIKLYSSGSLTWARDLWELALEADPGNRLLPKYLSEVKDRLSHLQKIKGEPID